jgi:hypothetical protein
LDIKVVLAVTSAIYIVADVYLLAVSRYLSPAVHIVMAKELNDPKTGALVSPK